MTADNLEERGEPRRTEPPVGGPTPPHIEGIRTTGSGRGGSMVDREHSGMPTGPNAEQRDLRVDSWNDTSHWYREEWERRSGGEGTSWENVEPAFRYGHEMAGDPRYRDREWQDVEQNLVGEYADWHARQGYKNDAEYAWDRVSGDVRAAWDRARGRRE